MEKPELEKPGAGLPLIDSLVMRFYLGPFVSRRQSKDMNLRLFSVLGSRMLKEADGVPANARDEQVLVPRMRGIEDSSRFWSVNETLEHVMIVGAGMRGLIKALAEGGKSDFVVRVEDFKPKGKYRGGDARGDFRAFLDETAATLKPLAIVDGGPKHRHPWFGEINALQWSWILSGHTQIHLSQLIAIKNGFKRP
jgi:hypothetical protein